MGGRFVEMITRRVRITISCPGWGVVGWRGGAGPGCDLPAVEEEERTPPRRYSHASRRVLQIGHTPPLIVLHKQARVRSKAIGVAPSEQLVARVGAHIYTHPWCRHRGLPLAGDRLIPDGLGVSRMTFLDP